MWVHLPPCHNFTKCFEEIRSPISRIVCIYYIKLFKNRTGKNKPVLLELRQKEMFISLVEISAAENIKEIEIFCLPLGIEILRFSNDAKKGLRYGELTLLNN